MPVSFQILPRHQIVLFSYSGKVGLQESIDAIAASARHPDHRPGMRQFCDLSHVTGVERDFPKLLQMQAKIAEDLLPGAHELIVLFYAPTRAGREMAQMARNSWEGLNSVIVLIQDDEAKALDLFGLQGQSISGLRQKTS